jgi:hypothetical protein
MCKVIVHFWIELKPMLPITPYFCKKYELCTKTLSRMWKNNIHLIL